MIFNAQQVTDIVSILQRHQLTFIAKQLGLNYLSPIDRAILTAAGVDLNQFTNSQGIVEQAYLFGLLSEALGDERSKGMDYKQFQKFIKSGQFVPLTEEEKFVLEQVKNQSYNDISGLGSKIIQGTRNIVVRANLRQQNKIRNIIKKKAIDAVQFRQSAAKMASEIGHATGDWERDWLRIAYYVLQNSYNYGRARAIFRDHGDDAEVYFDVLKGACQHCRELYLTDPDDEDSAPKIFKLKDILANGNNIGRKAADWLPTVSPIHPYCRCSIRYKDPNMEWDASTLSYTKPKKYVPKNKKLRNIKLNIKVSKAKEDLINSDIDFMLKAHQVGDIHPNGKWIWTEYAPGKFDWKSKNGKYYKNSGSAVGDQISKPVKVSKFTPDELKEDESVLQNSPDAKMKKTLAAKYGVNSMKADDIRKEVLKNLNELHKTKTKFDDEDLKWFNKYWDYPASPQKLRLAFRDESDEFLEYYKGVKEATYNAMPAGLRYNSMRGKSLEREIKALRDIVEERKNDNDQELKELIKNLNKETKVFHDDYINRTEEYHSRYFDNLEQMKDFHMSDFMSFFGVMGELQYNHIAERMNKKHSWNSGLKSSEMNLWYKYHSDTSQPFTSDVKTITVWGKKIQPKEIHVADYTRSGENVHADLPSKQALDYAGGVMMLKSNFGFDKKKYVTQMKLDAEKRYQGNMMIVADKVRQMHMDERNLSVKSIRTSVKGFDIVVSDGKKDIYARSIYAAENSIFVAPHFRFIVTDRTNMNVAKAQEDEFSQRLSQAKKDTNTKPTEAEIKAGNYKKGHVRFAGYEYVIENPKGSFRCGVDVNGKKWKTKMNNTYGYFLGTLGKDKDHIDVFINDDVDLDSFNGKIYVIDQVNKDKTFDEHKVMYGFRNKAEAKKAYLSNYDKGWRGCGNITGVKKEVFDKWIRSSKRKVKPFADYAEIN